MIERNARGHVIWTDEARQIVIDKWKLGMSASQIGREMGCSKSAVLEKIWRMGLSSKDGGGQSSQLPEGYWGSEGNEKLQELWGKDLSSKQICEIMGNGLTPNAIKAAAKRLGLGKRNCGRPTEWAQEDTEFLKEKWEEGWSAKLIGDAIGKTRSSVIGKVERLKLGSRVTTKRQRRTYPHKRSRKVQKLPKIRLPPEYRNLTLNELTNRTCKYAITDDSPYRFCGVPSHGSWCEFHRGVVFR